MKVFVLFLQGVFQKWKGKNKKMKDCWCRFTLSTTIVPWNNKMNCPQISKHKGYLIIYTKYKNPFFISYYYCNLRRKLLGMDKSEYC